MSAEIVKPTPPFDHVLQQLLVETRTVSPSRSPVRCPAVSGSMHGRSTHFTQIRVKLPPSNTSPLSRSDPLVLFRSDPLADQRMSVVARTVVIIHAAGVGGASPQPRRRGLGGPRVRNVGGRRRARDCLRLHYAFLGPSQAVSFWHAQGLSCPCPFPPTWITSAKQRWVNSGER